MTLDNISNANKPVSADGKTYHVETRWGQVANRILTVGDPQRARLIAKRLDKVVFEHQSHRGILTITGVYKRLPISIVAIGMGLSMMDFFVREVRMVVRGPLSIIRLGSCGSVCAAQPGDVIVASGAFGIATNHLFYAKESAEPYVLWPTVLPDRSLTDCLTACVSQMIDGGADHVFHGEVGGADSFYGAQGRIGDDFYDANSGLLHRIHEAHPTVAALEMECHMMFHLASISTGSDGSAPQSIRAACALVVFADRTGGTFISPEKSAQAFSDISNAALDALVIDAPIQSSSMHPTKGSVWEGEL
ncbi:hypothetical protein GGI23_001535 [Coemansia sp. RSA 2559]|nr:hypothetical protein GGI23_001535 [Coemansia sp. RSA 2559]KAJ2865877.1 hypothetical protein GGI22_001415 [Coemansia erecta]